MKKEKGLMKKILIIGICAMTILGLTACGNSKEGNQQAKGWNIKVIDEEGNPVGGVKLQMCTDEACTMASSLDDGVVNFNGDASEYTIHIANMPEGYEYNGEEIVAKAGEDTSIVLTKGGSDIEENTEGVNEEYPQIAYIDNVSYYNTNKECTEVPRIMPNGAIETFVSPEIMPDSYNSANFGSEYGSLEYIFLEGGELIIHIGDNWYYFEEK